MIKSDTVKKDRHKYVGGSDIPIIMGISPFKTRWELLQEKAGIIKNEFEGNVYTEYGNILEPKIRDCINDERTSKFYEDSVIWKNFRANVDGITRPNNEAEPVTILEIKTSSSYEVKQSYIYQLQCYMYIYNRVLENPIIGKLAIYRRDDVNDTTFDESKLYEVNVFPDIDLWQKISDEYELFMDDLEKLIECPLLTEQDLIEDNNNDIVVVANRVLALENDLKSFELLKKAYEQSKNDLYKLMEQNNVKKWTTPNLVKITRVDASTTVKEVFDIDRFKLENQALHDIYVYEKESSRKGYVKITLPK